MLERQHGFGFGFPLHLCGGTGKHLYILFVFFLIMKLCIIWWEDLGII